MTDRNRKIHGGENRAKNPAGGFSSRKSLHAALLGYSAAKVDALNSIDDAKRLIETAERGGDEDDFAASLDAAVTALKVASSKASEYKRLYSRWLTLELRKR